MTEQDAAFERCVDFLVRMMNKYGKEFLEDMEKQENISEKISFQISELPFEVSPQLYLSRKQRIFQS